VFGHDWQQGEAKVLALKNIPRNEVSSSYEIAADVSPSDGSPSYRTTFHTPQTAYGFKAPSVGDTIPVLCDVKGQKAKIDDKAPVNRWDTAQDADKAYFKAVKSGAIQPEVLPAPATAPEGATLEEQLRVADEVFQAAMARGKQALADWSAAKASGNLVETGRLKALSADTTEAVNAANKEYQRISALIKAQAPVATAVPAAGGTDPLDRLRKLADLHTQGVLDDAEFAAQKAKILAEM
jgi:hypothetical protein